MVELLSPAGNFTSLAAALKNGADSVYIGIHGFNMRAHTTNFSLTELEKAVNMAHNHESKLYLCTNTMMKNQDLDGLEKILPLVVESGADALIVSDLGALELIRDYHLEAHYSVQGNVSNTRTLHTLKKLGVKRVILSRELSLEEIKEISSKSPLEIEVFIHGAQCMALSGRCFLSSYLYQKNANCGECLQPCRKVWKMECEDGSKLILENQENMTHFLSPRDMCMIEYIPELMESGVSAFKIEGRARSADYVGEVTRVYQEAINTYHSGWSFKSEWLDDLKNVFNRGFDQGFYFQKPLQDSPSNQSPYIKKDVGEVVNYFSQVKAAEVRLWADLKVGDHLIIQGPTTGSIKQKVESMQMEGSSITKAVKGDNAGLKVDEKVRPGDLVYKKVKR
ncbi:MAG: U32 family peptidase [Euryarchaeota archaeon]|nr:U32 family peptidase [Euryarchaeota archaeon]MBV1729617.1 U32 family peptidase [Methanobacterium sp.]MBU4547962.1 U32 family peptidase [Euryarchaeota archaeon]MBU4608628.1 U32 family peptidase [Euryarchaeota archaeon]MBV1754045.1 U32 family peptidase [Methanobacterium sp.]